MGMIDTEHPPLNVEQLYTAHHIQTLCNEHKVYRAEPKLSDEQENVHNNPAQKKQFFTIILDDVLHHAYGTDSEERCFLWEWQSHDLTAYPAALVNLGLLVKFPIATVAVSA